MGMKEKKWEIRVLTHTLSYYTECSNTNTIRTKVVCVRVNSKYFPCVYVEKGCMLLYIGWLHMEAGVDVQGNYLMVYSC